MNIWRWWCSRYFHNHGFLLRKKIQRLKFRYTEVIHKKLLWVLLKCTSVPGIYEHVQHKIQRSIIFGQNWPRVLFWWKIECSYFGQSNVPYHSKMLNFKKKPYRELSDIRFRKFDPNWGQREGFSLLVKEIKRSSVLVKILLALSLPPPRKIPTTNFYPPPLNTNCYVWT